MGIVTIPFFFEGMNKIKSAIEGAARLQKNVDAMLIINNDRLASIYPDMAWDEAFSKADDILTTAARTISDMVTTLANINIDMRDVDTCLRDGRTALISVGYGEGENRMSQAIQSALHSPLLCDTNIMSAKELLFAFYYSHDLEPRLKVPRPPRPTTSCAKSTSRYTLNSAGASTTPSVTKSNSPSLPRASMYLSIPTVPLSRLSRKGQRPPR